MKGLVLVWITLSGSVGFAQDVDSFDKVLLPVAVVQPRPGAHDSLWTTEFSLVNQSSTPVQIFGYRPCPNFDGCAGVESVPPGATVNPPLQGYPDQEGYLLYVERGRSNDVSFSLRARDLSRQSQTWGTQIPVVRESDALSGPANLLDIPTNTSFRTMVRVFDFSFGTTSTLEVIVYGITPRAIPGPPDQLLFRAVVTLLGEAGDVFHPSYGEFLLPQIPEISQFTKLRIEIRPSEPGLRYWAFASVTHNETQHVTTITPR